MNLFENFDAFMTVLVAVGSSATTLLVTKLQTKKDVTINDRVQLSEDEKLFRAELKDTIEGYKVELKEARIEITELRKEVAGLHKINLKITLENKQLQIKVDDLRAELQQYTQNR